MSVVASGDPLALTPIRPRDSFARHAIGTPTRLGQTIRERRRSLEMSQDELAKRAGVSRGWVSRVENGKRDVQWTQVFRVLGALELRLDAHASE